MMGFFGFGVGVVGLGWFEVEGFGVFDLDW